MADKDERICAKIQRFCSLTEQATWDINEIKEDICDNYCKWPEIVYSMYKDVDEAQKCLEETKCETCPLNRL